MLQGLPGSHGFSIPTLVSPCRFDEPNCLTTSSSRHAQYPVYPPQRPNMIPNSQVLQEMIYPNDVGYQGIMPEYQANQSIPSPWMSSWHQRQNYPSFLSHPHPGEGYYGYNGEMVDYDDQNSYPQKRKRARTAFTADQLKKLEKRFLANHYIVGEERQKIADELDLSEAQVKVWFQNRRTKFKRDQELEKLGKTKKRKGEHHIRRWQLTTRHFGPETNQLFSDQSDDEQDQSL